MQYFFLIFLLVTNFVHTTLTFKGDLQHVEGSSEEIEFLKNFPFKDYKIYAVEDTSYYLEEGNDLIKNELKKGKSWESALDDVIKRYVKPNTTVLDIGAHIGTQSLMLSKLVGEGGQVIVFEPQRKLFRELIMNATLNGCKNVTAYQLAIGNEKKKIEMDPAFQGNEGATKIGVGGDIVEMVPLDDLNLKNISFIKIDVENFEYEVLEGAKKTILENKPVIVLEIMGNTLQPIVNREDKIKSTIKFLEDLGYTLTFIPGSWSDWLAVPMDNKTKKKTVCLNMIVKNEKDVITRCLNSVSPLIDYWVIVDTGSTDGTQEIIKSFMQEKRIQGELHERPWVNFEHNRNEALNLAKGKGDYLFFIDADEYLLYDKDFKLPQLDKDFYYITMSHSGTNYVKMQFIKNDLSWYWKGVLHEVLVPQPSYSFATLESVLNIYTTEGARSKDPLKYQKDAEILEKALLTEPENSRYVFYLAQSYRDGKNYPLAITNYEKRAFMGGWDEEIFWSLLQIANIKEHQKYPEKEVIESYINAMQYRKLRIEPYYYLAHHFREKGDFKTAYIIAKMGNSLPKSKDILFVQNWMQEFGLPLEQSINAYWIGKYEECQEISVNLLRRKDLPENYRTCIENNLGFANAKLLEQLTFHHAE